MNGLVCLRGRLLSPTRLLTDEGEFEVCPETFYKIDTVYVFELNVWTYPWRINKAIRLERQGVLIELADLFVNYLIFNELYVIR